MVQGATVTADPLFDKLIFEGDVNGILLTDEFLLKVVFVDFNATTTADSEGDFEFQDVRLKPGNHSYEIQTSDVAGNTQSSKRRFTFPK